METPALVKHIAALRQLSLNILESMTALPITISDVQKWFLCVRLYQPDEHNAADNGYYYTSMYLKKDGTFDKVCGQENLFVSREQAMEFLDRQKRAFNQHVMQPATELWAILEPMTAMYPDVFRPMHPEVPFTVTGESAIAANEAVQQAD